MNLNITVYVGLSLCLVNQHLPQFGFHLFEGWFPFLTRRSPLGLWRCIRYHATVVNDFAGGQMLTRHAQKQIPWVRSMLLEARGLDVKSPTSTSTLGNPKLARRHQGMHWDESPLFKSFVLQQDGTFWELFPFMGHVPHVFCDHPFKVYIIVAVVQQCPKSTTSSGFFISKTLWGGVLRGNRFAWKTDCQSSDLHRGQLVICLNTLKLGFLSNKL